MGRIPMHNRWVTNEKRSKASKVRSSLESETGCTHLIGRPSENDQYSTIELEAMDLVGIYREIADNTDSEHCWE